MEDSTKYCQEHLANKGNMTKHSPNSVSMKDIECGWQIENKLGELDVGLASDVNDREIIEVEG